MLSGNDAKAARALLRSGPFNGLRDNIRAIGEYAASSSQLADASSLVGGFFKQLEDFDRLLYESVRDNKELTADIARSQLSASVSALDKLIATVPPDVLAKSCQIVDVVNSKGSAVQSSTLQGEQPSAAAQDIVDLLVPNR